MVFKIRVQGLLWFRGLGDSGFRVQGFGLKPTPTVDDINPGIPIMWNIL